MRQVKGSYTLYQGIAYSFQLKGTSSQGAHYMSYLNMVFVKLLHCMTYTAYSLAEIGTQLRNQSSRLPFL